MGSVRRMPPKPVVPDFDEGHRDYSYVPLRDNEFRLLRLLRGERDTELQASLDIYDLTPSQITARNPHPRYEALSYAWGPKAEKGFDYSINIIKNNDSYRIFIRPNLCSALRQLRYLRKERLLWVDALCINQKSDDDDEKTDEVDNTAEDSRKNIPIPEKNIQIPKMHEIYNRANQVCVWLGMEADNSNNAMKFAADILNLASFNEFVQNADAESLADFATLLRRDWFSRRWIVQELAVARNAQFYCGQAQVPWKQFSGAISLFASKHLDLRSIFKASRAFDYDPDYLGDVKELTAFRLVDVASNFFSKSDDGDILERRVSLEEAVSMLTAFDSKDPKDIIYAVLSLANDATPSAKSKSSFEYDREKMDAFYTVQASNPNSPVTVHTRSRSMVPLRKVPSSEWRVRAALARAAEGFLRADKVITIKYKQPVFEVYKDFLELVVLHSKSLDIICRPWAADVPDLPSWIPRKSGAIFGYRSNRAYSRMRADLLVGVRKADSKRYSASRDTLAQWDLRDHPVLEKSLVVRGFILDTIDKILFPAMGGVIPEEWHEEWENLSQSSNQHSQDSFWRTLVGDCGLEGQRPPPRYFENACEHVLSQSKNYGYLDTRELLRDQCPSISKEFLERVQAVTWMRRLIISKKHHRLGLVPYKTEKDDIMCILYGCSVPVILRRHSVTEVIQRELTELLVDQPIPGIHVEDTDEANSPADSAVGDPEAEVQDQKDLRTQPAPLLGSTNYLPVADLAEQKRIKTQLLENRKRRQLLESTLADLDVQLAESQRPSRSLQQIKSVPSSAIRKNVSPATANSGTTDKNCSPPTSAEDSHVLNDDLSINNNTSSNGPGPTVYSDTGSVTDRGHPDSGAPINLQVPGTSSVNDQGQEQSNGARNANSAAPTSAGPKQMGRESRTESWRAQPIPRYYYQFIGECYVYGMMDGEALRFGRGILEEKEDPNPTQFQKQLFWLR